MARTHPLKAYRDREKLPRQAVAAALNVTVTTIGRWENGKRGVRKALLPKIEQTFRIPAEDILRFERGA